MENLIATTNKKLENIINDLYELKISYEDQLEKNNKDIETEYTKINDYKNEFNETKKKIEKMTNDISGFEEDYKHLVEKFEDDELSNILIAANKEVTAKIDERKKKILQDKDEMNELVKKAKIVKRKLAKLHSLKESLESSLDEITNSYNYYKESLQNVITNSNDYKNYVSKEEFEKIEDKLDEEIKEDKEEIILPNENNDELNYEVTIEDDFEKNDKKIETDDYHDDIELEEEDANLEDILNFDDSLEEQ